MSALRRLLSVRGQPGLRRECKASSDTKGKPVQKQKQEKNQRQKGLRGCSQFKGAQTRQTLTATMFQRWPEFKSQHPCWAAHNTKLQGIWHPPLNTRAPASVCIDPHADVDIHSWKSSSPLPITRQLKVTHHRDQAHSSVIVRLASLVPEFKLQNPWGRRRELALVSSSMTSKRVLSHTDAQWVFLNTESFQPHSGDTRL